VSSTARCFFGEISTSLAAVKRMKSLLYLKVSLNYINLAEIVDINERMENYLKIKKYIPTREYYREIKAETGFFTND
jgi:hypothetical protein